MENLMAVKELERGREFANLLRRLMFRGVDQEDEDKVKGLTTSSAEDLVAKVLDSFTNTLSLFNHHSADSSITTTCSFSQLPAHSDESHGNPKTKSPTTIKDQTRSSPKKRKSAQIQTWLEESKMTPKEDGHAWRKYGQKIILNTKYPRNYYRCTHKHDQGCKAIKHVEKIQDDPPLFRTTYFGHHTCTDPLNPHIFLDSDDVVNSTSAFILSFENNNNKNNKNNLITTFDPENNNNNAGSFFVSSGSLFPSYSSVKKEEHCDNNIKQEKNNNNNNDEIINVVASCSSNNDCFVSHPHEEETALPDFGYADYDQVDVFNSAAFYDPLGGFEDILLEII